MMCSRTGIPSNQSKLKIPVCGLNPIFSLLMLFPTMTQLFSLTSGAIYTRRDYLHVLDAGLKAEVPLSALSRSGTSKSTSPKVRQLVPTTNACLVLARTTDEPDLPSSHHPWTNLPWCVDDQVSSPMNNFGTKIFDASANCSSGGSHGTSNVFSRRIFVQDSQISQVGMMLFLASVDRSVIHPASWFSFTAELDPFLNGQSVPARSTKSNGGGSQFTLFDFSPTTKRFGIVVPFQSILRCPQPMQFCFARCSSTVGDMMFFFEKSSTISDEMSQHFSSSTKETHVCLVSHNIALKESISRTTRRVALGVPHFVCTWFFDIVTKIRFLHSMNLWERSLLSCSDVPSDPAAKIQHEEIPAQCFKILLMHNIDAKEINHTLISLPKLSQVRIACLELAHVSTVLPCIWFSQPKLIPQLSISSSNSLTSIISSQPFAIICAIVDDEEIHHTHNFAKIVEHLWCISSSTSNSLSVPQNTIPESVEIFLRNAINAPPRMSVLKEAFSPAVVLFAAHFQHDEEIPAQTFNTLLMRNTDIIRIICTLNSLPKLPQERMNCLELTHISTVLSSSRFFQPKFVPQFNISYLHLLTSTISFQSFATRNGHQRNCTIHLDNSCTNSLISITFMTRLSSPINLDGHYHNFEASLYNFCLHVDDEEWHYIYNLPKVVQHLWCSPHSTTKFVPVPQNMVAASVEMLLVIATIAPSRMPVWTKATPLIVAYTAAMIPASSFFKYYDLQYLSPGTNPKVTAGGMHDHDLTLLSYFPDKDNPWHMILCRAMRMIRTSTTWASSTLSNIDNTIEKRISPPSSLYFVRQVCMLPRQVVDILRCSTGETSLPLLQHSSLDVLFEYGSGCSSSNSSGLRLSCRSWKNTPPLRNLCPPVGA